MKTENLTSGDYKNYSRYTFNQDGSVVNKVTGKSITLEGEIIPGTTAGEDDRSKQYYRLTDDEGVRRQVKFNDIIAHFKNLQNPSHSEGPEHNEKMNAHAAQMMDEIRQENGETEGAGKVIDASPNAEKPAKPAKAPKTTYTPDPEKKPKAPLDPEYKIVKLSNDKIRLVDDDIRQIRLMAWEGKSQKEIRETFNIHPSTCSNIIGRKLHPNLDKE